MFLINWWSKASFELRIQYFCYKILRGDAQKFSPGLNADENNLLAEVGLTLLAEIADDNLRQSYLRGDGRPLLSGQEGELTGSPPARRRAKLALTQAQVV